MADVIGDKRTIIQGNSKQNQIYTECPLCYECRWTEMRNGVARYSRCKHHKPTPQTEQAKINSGLGVKNSYLDPINMASHCLGQKKRYERQEEHDLQSQRINNFIENHPEYRESQGADSSERFSKPEELAKLSKSQTQRWQRDGEKEHASIIHKKLWLNHDFATIMVAKLMTNRNMKPNKPESMMIQILNEYFPNLWGYVGNGKLIIDGKNPDFALLNGDKLVIEVFGDYWHNPAKREVIYHRTYKGRTEFFINHGYKSLILWEHEIKRTPKQDIANRVKLFMESN